MPCINPACPDPLLVGADDLYCPSCGQSQRPAPSARRLPPTPPPEDIELETRREERSSPHQRQTSPTPSGSRSAPPVPVPRPASPPTGGKTIVMRASEKIWHFREDEGPITLRPILILDERATHLSHTDRHLTPADLFDRVEARLRANQVPVQVELVKANWINDQQECRRRVMASLENHRFSDLKVIMGVDYLGTWATLQMHLGIEPEPKVDNEPISFPWGIALMLVGGSIGAFSFIDGKMQLAVLGAILLAIGFFLHRWQRAEQQQRREEQLRQQAARAMERLSRTFKIDDLRLFASAMEQVFQEVVDDIVVQGARVVRIEGGRGEFFSGPGADKAQPAPAPRVSDAAEADV